MIFRSILSSPRNELSGFVLFLLSGLVVVPASAQASAARDGGSLLDKCPSSWALGASNPCEFTEPSPLPYREYIQYYVTVPASPNFDLAITVVSNRGDIDIQLLAPDRTVVSSSAERIGEDVVQIRRTVMGKAPGNYTLLLQAVAQAMSEYTVRIQTTVAVTRLAAEELALMASITQQCCSPDDDMLPDSCTTLNAAISPNATEDDDLCLQPPNMCDSQGRLTKLVLSGGDKGNFVCRTFPMELGQLTQLQVLDWTSNGQVGTLAYVASVLAPLAGTLKRLYMGRNAISGPLNCQLVSQTALEILRLDRNLLSGSIPACMFQSPNLRYLSLSGNLLRGSIPQLPPNCALNVLDLSDNGPPNGAVPGNPGFTGPLPTLLNAVNLSTLDVQSNSLNGSIPAVPVTLQVLKAADNSLRGPLPPSLEVARDLRVLDLSRNQLTGTLSGEITNNELLTVLRLAGNRLVGDLPYSSWGNFLVDVDLSENNFTGGASSYLLYRPSLINLNLAANSLRFDIQEMAKKLDVSNSMLYFNISGNDVYGQLTAELGRMRLFNQLLLQAVDDEALQGSMAPQPLFDITYNLINSTFPITLLPFLGDLYQSSPYDFGMPLTVKLQPQTAPAALWCPPNGTKLSPSVTYLEELQSMYDMSCKTADGQLMNATTIEVSTEMPRMPPLPPKAPKPPRPPPSPPARPRRRPPPPPPGNITASDDYGPQEESSVPTTGKGISNGDSGEEDRGSSDVGAGSPPPLPPPRAPGKAVVTQPAGKKSSNSGAIAGAVVGGIVAVVLAGLGWYLYRRNANRRGGTSSRRQPLTYNAMYEAAPSEGTASNYADLQMFEFKATERPARQRARMS